MDENNKDEDLKRIRTYSSDMADAIHNDQASVVRIAMAEQRKHEKEDAYKKATGTKTSKTIWLVGGIVFILLGLVSAFFIFGKTKINNTPLQVTKNVDTFIAYDEAISIDITNVLNNSDMSSLINGETSKASKPNSIKAIFLITKENGKVGMTTASNFLSLIGATAPSGLVNSLSDSYMIGSYNTGETNDRSHLFLMFNIKNYNLAYASMLSWEKTILDDMFAIYNINVSGDNKKLFEVPWKDIVINNKDARVLYDGTGIPILYYLFLNKNYFVITDNQDTIREIITRLIIKGTKPL